MRVNGQSCDAAGKRLCGCCTPCAPESLSWGLVQGASAQVSLAVPSQGVRTVSDPCVGERRALGDRPGSGGDAGSSKHRLFIRLPPCKHKPRCCCASRPRSRLESGCGLGPKAIASRAVNRPFVPGSGARCLEVKPFCMLWVTSYDVALSRRSLAQHKVLEGLGACSPVCVWC